MPLSGFGGESQLEEVEPAFDARRDVLPLPEATPRRVQALQLVTERVIRGLERERQHAE